MASFVVDEKRINTMIKNLDTNLGWNMLAKVAPPLTDSQKQYLPLLTNRRKIDNELFSWICFNLAERRELAEDHRHYVKNPYRLLLKMLGLKRWRMTMDYFKDKFERGKERVQRFLGLKSEAKDKGEEFVDTVNTENIKKIAEMKRKFNLLA